LVASIVGLLAGLAALIVTKNKEYRLPFAPMIALGGISYIFVGF
jgi:prepilin signal peptidase PulO-like enzyme (type II secretory pathway)